MYFQFYVIDLVSNTYYFPYFRLCIIILLAFIHLGLSIYMKLISLILCIYLAFAADTECPNPIVPSSDRRKDKSKLRIVQYNAEWLFYDYYSNADCPGSKCTWVNQSEALIHMNYVSDVIRTLNPDIINVCEVEGCDELNMVSKMLDGTYVSYLKKGTDTATGQNVGLLTRIDPLNALMRTEEKVTYPVTGSLCGYNGTGTSGVSKHYYTYYKLLGMDVLLFGAHLLAFPEDHMRCAEREAQAQVIQNVISAHVKQGYQVILMGDFNDFDGKVVDMNGNKPLSKVLEIVKGNDGNLKGTYQLFNAAQLIGQSERWTDWWDQNSNCVSTPNEFSMIDHILMTSPLLNKVSNMFVYHGYPEFCGKYNSDHYPVVIDFTA